MHTFRVAKVFDGVPSDFWAVLLDLDYVRAFNGSAAIDVELIRLERRGGRVERDLRYRSARPVPLVVRPFFPEGIGYVEHGVLDEVAGRYEHRLEPVPLGSRAELAATITLEVTGVERFRYVYEGAFSIRVPLIGGRLEREAAAAFSTERPEASALTQSWVSRRAAERRAGRVNP
jgi:hypothetical protein